ncbi:MAG TPA: VOC family protein [Thermoanaerobaculia bacterium]|nr:VOC family protein [Thermoanaerobaculia bacterium]
MPIATLSLVALDCAEPRELAEFYQRVLGGEIVASSPAEDWVTLKLGGGCDLAFQRDPRHRAPVWPGGLPQQLHLDFDVPDLDAGESAVIAAGAVKAGTQPEPDSWRVFLDPSGHPFCLVKA